MEADEVSHASVVQKVENKNSFEVDNVVPKIASELDVVFKEHS